MIEKIKSYSELKLFHEECRKLLSLRYSEEYDKTQDEAKNRIEILVCGGTGCKSSNADEIINTIIAEIDKHNLSHRVSMKMTGCFGFCEKGPIVKIIPDNTFYIHVSSKDVSEIFNEHILKGNVVERLLYEEPTSKEKITKQDEMGFYKKQKRIALRNCGVIDPENIKEYIGAKGYLALGKVISEMTPDDVIKEITASGLRGRGGGGFPTGKKWNLAKDSKDDIKYIICNADEGDPGAFMDRAILEGDPNSIIEAMAIAGYAIGASKGLIYIRAEYPLAVQRLTTAIEQAKRIGVIGEEILGSSFNFDLEIKYGAGAFVCGEETALMHSIEGSRGEPTTKPPFPAEKGLFNKPTSVNNVETFANITAIINNGSEWFSSIGTNTSKGTKVFALAGKIKNVGLVEVPMGIKLEEIIYEIGGGIKDNKEFKAVQTGGPSGGCIPSMLLDLPIDYESLNAVGSMMGSGGMIVMDEDNCMVDIAKFYLEFIVDESCGKCTPCRIGNKRLLEILNKIVEGKGTDNDIKKLRDLSKVIKDTALCGLGQTAPNPILSTMTYFMDEYNAHVDEKKCPAGKCKKLVKYQITDECVGCTKCSRLCPTKCITGKLKEKHLINQEKCIKCGTCFEGCPVKAIKLG